MKIDLFLNYIFFLGISVIRASPESVISSTKPESRITLNDGTGDNVSKNLNSGDSVRIKLKQVPHVMDGTEYGESTETASRNSKHFLRKPGKIEAHESHREFSQSTLDVDESFAKDVDDGIEYLMSTFENLPQVQVVDSWAQETRAGFMGYMDSLKKLWDKESKSVGNKLFEAADGYSHRFFNLLHVKESDHPVIAAKMTRIILAMTISLALVFVVFGLALHLQKSIVARAHEEAGKQQPRLPGQNNVGEGEQLFFAMPYPHIRDDGKVVIVDK